MGVRSPSLLPLHAVESVSGGFVLVLDRTPAGTLAELLAARRRLQPGEVVTLAEGVVDALTALHRAGLTHGAVDVEAVRLGLDGRPLLGPVGAASATLLDDVTAAAALCRRALGTASGPAAAEPVRSALLAALAPPFTDAAGLGAVVRSSAPAVPIRVTDPDGSPRPEPNALRSQVRTPSGPPWRRLAVASLASVALLAAVITGVGWARRAERPSTAALPAVTSPPINLSPSAGPAPEPAPIDWTAVVRRLDARRAAAFARLDHAALEATDAAGSAVLRRDRAVIAALASRGGAPRGVGWEVLGVEVVGAGPPGVIVLVTDRMRSYDVVARGRVVARAPPRGTATWRLTLVPVRRGWRVAEVTPG